MGRMKELWMDQLEEEEDRKLAGVLGITYDELLELNHSIDTEESNEGVVFSYIISFDKHAPKEILRKVKGLDEDNQVWLAPWEIYEDEYYDEQYDAIISNKHYYDSFLQALASAEKLNAVDIGEDEITAMLKRQTYVSVIAALEAFLSETFINLTDENEVYFRRFIETFPDFKETKFDLSKIYSVQEKLKETAKKAILEVLYHNLPKVSKMYSSTFGMVFPDISELFKCVSIRHDLVHRNGKTKNGDVIAITTEDVDDLIQKSREFAKDIAQNLGLTSEGPAIELV